jgi:hypothetical protein
LGEQQVGVNLFGINRTSIPNVESDSLTIGGFESDRVNLHANRRYIIIGTEKKNGPRVKQ